MVVAVESSENTEKGSIRGNVRGRASHTIKTKVEVALLLLLGSFLFSQSCFAFLLPCFYICLCPKLSFLFSFPSKHCYDEMIFVV